MWEWKLDDFADLIEKMDEECLSRDGRYVLLSPIEFDRLEEECRPYLLGNNKESSLGRFLICGVELRVVSYF